MTEIVPDELAARMERVAGLLADPVGAADVDALVAWCTSTRVFTGAAAVSVARLDDGDVVYLAADGAGAGAIVGTRLSTERGLAGFAVRSGQTLAIDRVADDHRFARDVAERSGFVPTSMLVLPVVGDDERVLGVVSILDRDPEAPGTFLPAWSEPFHRVGGPGALRWLLPGPPPDRRWAFGDGRGAGVRVAVVDSGVDASHPLVGRVADSLAVETDDAAPDGVRFVHGPHDDLYGHGTACAGVLRAVAPDVELLSVRVLGADLTSSARAFAHAVQWCIERGVDIVNVSMSTSSAGWVETFHDLVEAASRENVWIVACMNNQHKRTVPGEFAGTFSVACAPGHDREHFLANPRGPADFGAPGIDVEVAWLGGGTATVTGNSFAAPVVSGHLARIRATHPEMTAWQARAVLVALADNAS